MSTLTIGQVAKEAGVGVETLRYYEREGLVKEPPRRDSGYRQYPEDVVKRIHFIKRAQELGFSLKEIAELLALRVGSVRTQVTPCQRSHASSMLMV
jgi:MerR family transcriptional regulator, copper efflux regulator